MRNRHVQRALRRAGVRREELIGPRNPENYADPTPQDAVRRIKKGIENLGSRQFDKQVTK